MLKVEFIWFNILLIVGTKTSTKMNGIFLHL